MWVLDPGNSEDLLARLRPRSASSDFDFFEVLWCGEGWRALVSACHEELSATFPDYRFRDIRQEGAALRFDAVPRLGEVTPQEIAQVREITDRYRVASEAVCEWCGRSGSLRTELPESYVLRGPPGRAEMKVPGRGSGERLTLCDRCAEDMTSTPWPHSSPFV